MHQNIIGFDIPVNQVIVIENLVAFAELPDQFPNFHFRKMFIFGDIVLKGALVAEFHDEVKIIFRGELNSFSVHEIRVRGKLSEYFEFGFDGFVNSLFFERNNFGD